MWNFKKSKLNNYFIECGEEFQRGYLQGLQLSGTIRMEHSLGRALSHRKLVLVRNIVLGTSHSTAIVSTCIFIHGFPSISQSVIVIALKYLTIAMGKLKGVISLKLSSYFTLKNLTLPLQDCLHNL